jgi:2,4-dienoyl-CoA reductase-like NADH-dependent reductase (Old Yellow Enzyme family)
MSLLFTSAKIGTLTLPNRLVRSATAERMADAEGRPRPQLVQLYRELARGGVGLIIAGHMYVHPSGKCHPEMTAIDSDDLIPALTTLTEAVHAEGGKIAVQINHGGMRCSRSTVSETIAPSAVDAAFLQQPARAMTPDEITMLIHAYAQAARRAKVAGFDAVQLHGAHGYLIEQFLSPFVNRRDDEWGGDLQGRMHFLRAVCESVREEVGLDYPVFIKLGMMDAVEGGLTPDEGAQVAAALAGMDLDAVEVSGGIGGDVNLNSRVGIRTEDDEAYFRDLAKRARTAMAQDNGDRLRESTLPILLVGGLRSRKMMDDVLESGDADFIALSRPLICEPDLPQRLRQGQARAACISASRCWPADMGEGIACKCSIEEP